MDYFEYCLRILAPLPRPTATKLEAVSMITGVVSLFVQGESAQRRAAAPALLFSAASAEAHPLLIAALTRPEPRGPKPDLFQRTIRSVLGGLLSP